jgi:ribosomal protein S20
MRSMKLAVGAVALAIVAGLLLLGAASLVQAQTPGGDGSVRQRHQELLAQKLGISVEQLQSAQKAVRDQLIDEARASGKITEDKAARLKSREPGAFARGRIGGLKAIVNNVLEAAASATGVSREEIKSGLKGGQSLAEIAGAEGITREQLKSRMQADLQRRIQEAQANGTISQEQATRLIDALDQHLDQVIDRKGGARKSVR